MNRQKAEKLLAALIFGDLDETSKADLTAYLQTDDELRERLADMRMAVKVASDALQHGPDPVLGKKRLKHLARLARQRTSSSRRSAVFTVRYMAAAAAILIAVMLPSFLMFNRTAKPKGAWSLAPGDDIGGGYSEAYELAAKVAEVNMEYTDGTSPGEGMEALPIVLPKPTFVGTPTNASMKLKPASDQNGSVEDYNETASGGIWNDPRGSSKMAEAIWGKSTHGEGTRVIDSVNQVQHSWHGEQVDTGNTGLNENGKHDLDITGDSTISMTAATGSDVGGAENYFEESSGNPNNRGFRYSATRKHENDALSRLKEHSKDLTDSDNSRDISYDLSYHGGGVWNDYAGSSTMAEPIPGSGSVTTEESSKGKKQSAKAIRGEDRYGNGVDHFSLRGGQAGTGDNGQNALFGDGHFTWSGEAAKIADFETIQDAVDAAADGDTTVIITEHSFVHNSPIEGVVIQDAVASQSSPGDIKANWDYDGGPGGGQYKLKKSDSAGGIAGNGATIRTGEKLTETMDSSGVTDESIRWRSTTGSNLPAYTRTRRSATAKTPARTTRPQLPLPPVVASPRLTESDPKSRSDNWTRGMVTNNTEGEEMASIRKQTLGSKNDADGKEFNIVMSPKPNAPASEISGPSGDVRYNAVIVDGAEKYSVAEEAKRIQISSRGLSDVEGVVHDNIYTVRSKIDRKVLHEDMANDESFLVDDTYTMPSISNCIISDKKLGNADSLLINDTEGGIELAKAKNKPIPGDSPAGGPVSGRGDKKRLVGAEEMERTSEDFDGFVWSGEKRAKDAELRDGPYCKVDVRILDVLDMASISEGTESSGEKEAKDAELRAGFRANLEENYSSRVGDSGAPVGEDEPDLPPASRFKSVPVNPWVMAERDSLSTFALDVDTASYTLCRRYIHGGFLPPAGAVRMEEFVNYFNYHYPQRADRTFTVHAEAAASPFAGKGKNLTLLKIGVKARTIGRDQRKAAHLILVIDTSASMGKPDRLGLVQQALNLLIDKLSPADRVTLITCSNQARLHMEAASASQRDRIRQVINAIQPSGSTNLLAGLKLGYAAARRSFDAKGINHVVLCSDGVANVGQTEADAVLKAVAADRKQGIAITCVGVGYGSYNDAFLESLANRGDGSYVFLDSARQAKRVFVEQLAATLHTVAKDARIQVSFNPDRVRRYRLIGYENRDIEDKRFRDDTVDAGEVGSGQCSTALYELELTGQPSANQRQGLGTVFVRYRHADTGQMEEISHRLKNAIVQRRKVESSPRFFLAAAAAQFAEIMRQSEHAQQGSLTDVLAVAEKVSLTLPLDRDVRQLTELIRKAEHLPRSQ